MITDDGNTWRDEAIEVMDSSVLDMDRSRIANNKDSILGFPASPMLISMTLKVMLTLATPLFEWILQNSKSVVLIWMTMMLMFIPIL